MNTEMIKQLRKLALSVILGLFCFASIGQTPPDPVILASPSTICGSGSVSFTIQGENCTPGFDIEYRWFTNSSTSTPTYTGNCYNTTISSTTTIYVEAYSNFSGQSSNRVSKTVLVGGNDPSPTAPSVSRCGAGLIELQVQSPSGSYVWRDSNDVDVVTNVSAGITVLNNGATLRFDNLTATATYKVAKVTNGCAGQFTSVTGTIHAVPSAPTVTSPDPLLFCGASSATLNPNSSGALTYRWYSQATGGTYTESTSKDVTLNSGATEDVWVSAVNSQGCESGRTQVTVESVGIPPTPSVTNTTLCGSGDVTIKIDGYSTNVLVPEYRWYSDAALTTYLGSGSILETKNFNANETYYVIERSDNGDCDSGIATLEVIVNPLESSPVASDQTICGPGFVDLSVSGASGTYKWFDSNGDEVVTDVAAGISVLNNGANLQFTNLATTSTFNVGKVTNGCLGNLETVIATVLPVPAAPTVSSSVPLTFCGPGTITLTPSTANATAYRWYTVAVNGTYEEAAFKDLTLSAGTSQTVWVSAVNAQGCESARTSITATSTALPTSPPVVNATVCGSGDVTIKVDGYSTNVLTPDFRWYSDAALTNEIWQGSILGTINFTSDSTFYVVEQSDNGVCSSIASVLTVDVIDIPNGPVINTSYCRGNVELTLDVTEGIYEWYYDDNTPITTDLANGIVVGANGLDMQILALNQDTTVKVKRVDGCHSLYTSQLLEVAPTFVPQTINAARFGPGKVTIGVEADPCLKSYNWYLDPTQSQKLTDRGDSQLEIYLDSTTNFYLSSMGTFGNESPNRVTVTGHILPVPGIASNQGDMTLVQGSSIQLSSITAADTYQWYKDGVLLQDETTSSYIASQAGIYSLEVSLNVAGGVNYHTKGVTIYSEVDFQNLNYVEKYTAKKKGIKTPSEVIASPIQHVSHQIDYMSDAGLSLQTVNEKASPQQSNLVKPSYYNLLGLKEKDYLAYADTSLTVSFDEASLTKQAQFYNGSDPLVASSSSAFKKIVFEKSPLKRVVEEGAPGENWQPGAGNTTTFSYEINASDDSVYRFQMSQLLTQSSVFYPSKSLYKNKTVDPDGNTSFEFKDGAGRVILKRLKVDANSWANTYYVYDDYSQLRIVIPPAAADSLEQYFFGQNTINRQLFLDQWAFQYKYDARQRMIEKKVPGADPVYMVYDKWDRLVLTQDGNQRANNQWLFTKYDGLNRPFMTGMMVDADPVDTLREDVAGATVRYDVYDSTGFFDYTDMSYPTNSSGLITEVFTVTYYDNYDFLVNFPLGITGYSRPTELEVEDDFHLRPVSHDLVNGMVTGTLIRNLSNASFISSVSFYDRNYRVIQVVSDNHLGGNETTSNQYDFAGNLRYSITESVLGGDTTTIAAKYTYDHANRLIDGFHKINQGTFVNLFSNEYNEIGELVSKKLHGKGTDFEQKVDYLYNIRGWLKSINGSGLSGATQTPDPTDLFSMELIYNNSISEIPSN